MSPEMISKCIIRDPSGLVLHYEVSGCQLAYIRHHTGQCVYSGTSRLSAVWDYTTPRCLHASVYYHIQANLSLATICWLTEVVAVIHYSRSSTYRVQSNV